MSVQTFRQVTSAGRRLPAKSTFFHPKLPNGLVLKQLPTHGWKHFRGPAINGWYSANLTNGD